MRVVCSQQILEGKGVISHRLPRRTHSFGHGGMRERNSPPLAEAPEMAR